MASALALWLALPPCDLWPLAWIAPVGWLLLVRMRRLPGRRPYFALWAAGFVFWLLAYHWLRLPHPATGIGWVALAFYLGFYLPVFVGLSRVAVHRWHMPLMLAAPAVWTGLELARGHLLSGITMASLGHTQYHWIAVMQLSDLAGAYGVGFVVMAVAACAARMLPCDDDRFALWPLPVAGAILAATLGYGYWRDVPTPHGAVEVALIQGAIDTELKEGRNKPEDVFRHYVELSQRAVRENPEVGLVVWPEAMFRYPLFEYDDDAALPPGTPYTEEEFRQALPLYAQSTRRAISHLSQILGRPMILGIDRLQYRRDGQRYFNSAAYISTEGGVVATYDKMHPVVFGEYVPFVQYLPWLQKLTPLATSLTAGDKAAVFQVGKLRYAPSICYENVLPHLIRRHVLSLGAEDREPDILVNLTNDGWFWGSSELDMHLACAVFRAVECRKPMLVAANTGFSAWIDGSGRIVVRGPRRQPWVVIARPAPDPRVSWYLRHGDWFAGVCLAFCGVLAGDGLAFALRRARGWPGDPAGKLPTPPNLSGRV